MDSMDSLGSDPAHMREQVSFGFFVPHTAAMEHLESAGGPLLKQTSSFFNIGEDPFASVPGTSSLMPVDKRDHGPRHHHHHTSSSDVQLLLEEIHLAHTYAEAAQRAAASDAQGSSLLHTGPGEQLLFQAPTLTDGLASGVHDGISQAMDAANADGATSGTSNSPKAHVQAGSASDESTPRRRTLGDGPLPAGYPASAAPATGYPASAAPAAGYPASAAPAAAAADEAADALSRRSSSSRRKSYSAPTELLAPVPEHGDEHSAAAQAPTFSVDISPIPTTSQHAQQQQQREQQQRQQPFQMQDPYSTPDSNTQSSSTSSHEMRPARPTILVEPAASAPPELSPVDPRLHAPRSRRPSDGTRPSRQRRRSTGELSLPSYRRFTADGLSPAPRSSSRRSNVDEYAHRSITELSSTNGMVHASSSPSPSPHGRIVQVPGGMSLEAIEAALGPRPGHPEIVAAKQLPAADASSSTAWGDASRSVDQVGMLAAAMAAVRGSDGGTGAAADVTHRPRRSSTREIKTAFDVMQAQIAKLEQTNMELQERIIMVQTALAESQAALADAQSDAIAAGSSKQQLEDQVRHLTARVKSGEHQVEFLSRQLDAQQQQLRASADELAAKAQSTSTLDAEINTLKERIAELNREVDAGRKKMAYEAEEARRAAAEAAAVKRENQALQDNLNKARMEVVELKERLSSSQAEMSRKVAELSGQAGALEEELQDMRHVATGLDAKAAQLEAANAQLSAQLAAAEGARATLRQQLKAARAAATAANAAAAAAAAAARAPVQFTSPPPNDSFGPTAAAWQSPPLHQQQQQQQLGQAAGRPSEYGGQVANGHITSSYSSYAPAGYDMGQASYMDSRGDQWPWQHQQQQPAPYWSPSPPPSPPPQYSQHQQLHGSPDPTPGYHQQQPVYYPSQQPSASGRPSTGAPLTRSYDAPAWFAAASRPADVRSSLQVPPQRGGTSLAGPSSAATPASWHQHQQQPQQQQQQQQQQAYLGPPAQWSAVSRPQERPGSAGPAPPPYATAGSNSAPQAGWQGYGAAPPAYGPTAVLPSAAHGNGSAPEQAGFTAAPSPVRKSPSAGPSPYGTDLTLGQLMATTKQLEDGLLMLSRERDELESEFAKMPLHGGRTLRERQRKVEVEARLEELRRDISNTRLQLKRLGH